MHVLKTYKDEKNQMKHEGGRVVTTLYSYNLSVLSSVINSVVGGRVWRIIDLIQAFVCLFLLLYVPSQQLWSLRDGQFTLPHFFLGRLEQAVNQ